ncbi:MAG: hypothetical protein Q7S22_03945, partial [Candidatus Micrarchaeota archaeon]|nr:hypothetical protein [Candidatus Micrarchaeota archaeon]
SMYLGLNSGQLLDPDEIVKKLNKKKPTEEAIDEVQVIKLRNQALVLLRTYCAENLDGIMEALYADKPSVSNADLALKLSEVTTESEGKEKSDKAKEKLALPFSFIDKPIIPVKQETIPIPSPRIRGGPFPPLPRSSEHLLLDHRDEENRSAIKKRLEDLLNKKPKLFEQLKARDSGAYTALLAGFSLNGSLGTPNHTLEARALTRLRALILPPETSNVVLPTSESIRSIEDEEREGRAVRRRSKIKDEGSQEVFFEEPAPKRVAPNDEEVETQDEASEGESAEEDGNHEESGTLESTVLPHGSSDLDQISFDPDLDVGDDELELPGEKHYPNELQDVGSELARMRKSHDRSAGTVNAIEYAKRDFVHACIRDGTLEKLKGIDKRAYETLKIKYGDEVEVIINSAVGVELAKLEGKEKSIDQSTVGVICRRGLEKLQQLVRGEEIASVHTRSHFQKLPGQAVRVEAIQSPPSALQSETTRPTVILRRPATIVSSVSSPIPSPVSTASSPITNPPVQVTALTNTELVEVLSLDSNITDNIKRKKDVLLQLESEGKLTNFQTRYPREYSVIKFRYFGNKVMEYDRIANELSKVEHGKMLTEERIRQIEKQALKHLINQLSGVTVQPVSEPKIEVGVKQIAPVLTKEKEEILVVLNGSRHTQEKQYVLRNVLLQLETQGYLEILAGTDQRYATYLVDRYLKDEKIKPLEEMAKLLGVKSTGTVEKIEQKSLYAISELVRYDSNSISVVTSELTLSADKKSNRARIRQVLLKIHRTGWLEELKIISEKQYLTLILRHGLNGSTALKMVDTRVKLAELTGKSEPYGLTTILIHEQSAIKNVVAILERKMKEGIINVGRGSKVDTRSLKLAVGVSGVEVGTEKIPRLQDPRPLIPDQPFTAPSSGQPFVESLARIPEPVPVLQSHRLHSILGETNPRVFMGKILNGTAPDVLAMIKSGFGNGTTNLEVAAILREEAAHIKIIGANAFWMQGGGKPHTLIGPAVNNPASVLQSKAAEIESLQI